MTNANETGHIETTIGGHKVLILRARLGEWIIYVNAYLHPVTFYTREEALSAMQRRFAPLAKAA